MSSVGAPSYKCEFEISPHVTDLTGEIQATVYEVGGSDPTGIIRTNQDWYVVVDWSVTGSLARHLCGEYCICLYIECIGAGKEGTLGCVRVPFDPCGTGQYSTRINVPAGTVTAGPDCGQVCCLAVTLTSFDICGNPGHIAAYCKGPCIMFALPPVTP